MRIRSSVVRPGLRPSSVSARRTHSRSVSRLIPQLVSDRADRGARRVVLGSVLEGHPYRTFTCFDWVMRSFVHDPFLSSDGVSGKPGAIHLISWTRVCDSVRAQENGQPSCPRTTRKTSRQAPCSPVDVGVSRASVRSPCDCSGVSRSTLCLASSGWRSTASRSGGTARSPAWTPA